jgi:hypothetical protein
MATAALRFAPDFRVTINGHDLPAALRSSITSVRYQDGTQAADRVELGIANVDLRWLQQHIKGLGFQPFPTGISIGPTHLSATPEGLFDIDNTLRLSLGYAPGPLQEVFKGDVTGCEVTFPSGGMPTMTLVAHDYLHRLTEGSYARGLRPAPRRAHCDDPERGEPAHPADRSNGRRRIDRDRGDQLRVWRERAEAEGPERSGSHEGDRRRLRRGLLGGRGLLLLLALLPQGVLAAADAAVG